MLFFNFLCLFYLMVLINSHTISKSIAKDDEIINVIDSVRDLENDKEHDVKQKRFHIRNAFHKDTSNIREEWSTKENPNTDVSTLTTDNINLTMDLKDKSNEILVSKSRRKGFFRRILDKIKRKNKKNYVTNKWTEEIRTPIRHSDHISSNESFRNENENIYSQLQQNRKRIQRRRLPKRQVSTLKSKQQMVTNSDGSIKRYWLPENFMWRSYYPFTAIRTYTPVIQKNNEMSLSEMTTKINYLKEVYGMTPRGFAKFMSIMTNPVLNYNWNQQEGNQESTTALQNQNVDTDSLETSQIEELLNKMKMKAVQDVTVSTEPAFENYPVSYEISRNVKSAKTKKKIKRELESNTRNKLNYGSVNDLKKVYAKVKNELSKDLKMSEKVIRNETQYWAKKLKSVSNINKAKGTTKKIKTLYYDVAGNSQHREKKLSFFKYDRNEYTTFPTISQPATDDDYSLISKCELLLKNAYQSNNALALTTENVNNYFDGKNIRPIRNSNYGAFIAPSIYEDIDNTSIYKPVFKYKTSTQENYPKVTTTYKELADKLYYNDYVNGYKHYLKFQKEQGVQNYSNLVRYQAHRHHSVDDIGKFILDKLPHVPNRHIRAFYDESATTEDQDVSSKSEESWFKKHFYLFIDSGQPKKYHSSQTVSLRPTATKTEKLKSKNDFIKENHSSLPNNAPKHTGETDLDHLTNILDMFKSHLVPPAKNSLKNRFNSKSEKKYNLKVSTAVDTNSPHVLAQSRLKRNKHNHVDNNEYQLFRSYLPKTELSSRKELLHEKASPTLINKNERYGYVDVSLVTQPTAVVKLRNAKHEGVLKKILNHFRLPFHKKKAKEMTKTTTQRNSSRKVRCLNPLKKLKKMFNVRIDGKPIILGSKIFDYDIIDTHIDPYKQINYDKQSVNLDDLETKIPTVIPETSNATGFPKDSHFNTSVQQVSILAKKYYQNQLDNTADPGTLNNNGLETSGILVDAKINPLLPTPTVLNTKNKAEFDDSELINIKVTTVKNFNSDSYSLPYLPFVTESSFVGVKKFKRHENTLMFPLNVQKNYLSNRHLRFKHEIKETKKIKTNNESQNVEKIVKVHNRNILPNAGKSTENNQHDASNNGNNIEKNEQGSKQALINLNRIAKANAKSHAFNNTKKIKSKTMHRYKVTPNYFNDLEMWHNDILNSENYTTWQNILKSIQQPLQYRPPNVNVLRKELDRINIRMGDIKESVTNVMKTNENPSKNTRATGSKKAFKPKSLVRRECNRNQIPGRTNAEYAKHLNKTHDNHSNTNLSATTTNKYHAADNVHIDTEKVKFKTGTSTEKYSDTIPETTLSLDTTLLAYDDSLNFLTETKEATLKTSLKPHTLDPVNLLTKLHKVPEQYFSTPLPMRSEDFEVFLKEHNIDVESVTTPLNFSSNDTLRSNDENNVLNILPQSNESKLKEVSTTKEVEELTNISQNTVNRNSISTPIKKIGRYLKNELENNVKDKFVDVSFTPKNDFNDERSRREIYKYLHIAASKPDYLLAGIYSKYSKFKNHFKNVDRQKYETSLSRNFTIKPNRIDGTEHYLDILENRLESCNNDTNNGNDTGIGGTITGAKTFKHLTENHLHVHNFPQSRKYVDFNPFENKTNVNMSEPSRVNPDVNAKTNVNEKHTELVQKEKPDTSYTNFVHNNLLFNYMYDNGKKEKVNKYSGSNAISYNVNNENSIIVKNRVTPEKEIKLPTTNGLKKLYSNPRRIHVSSKTLNYDIIFDDYDTTHKHDIHKLDERYDSATVRDEVFENNHFHSLSTKESTSDSEDEQIKELVRVVEAVDNFTRPNVLLYVDLPTYYLPDTNSTDPTPIRSPPKSFWNDFILKYVSGIALIELLTKFGILKTVEANFSDGMDEDVNKYGRFSGAAEPSFAMDLMSPDSIRRVLRSGTEESTTEMSTASSLEPIKKGTMIYDLKQLGRPHSDGLKSRNGPYRKGTSILSLLLKQGRVSLKETTRIVIPWSANNKSSTKNSKAEVTTITSKIERNIKDNESKEVKNNENKEINQENRKASKTTEECELGKQDAPVTKLTTTPVLLKAFGTIAIHTLQDKEKEHTTARASPSATEIKSKDKLKTNMGDYRLYLATTKILPKDSAMTNHKENNVDISTNTKITPPSGDKSSNVAKITTVIGEASPVTKLTRFPTRKLTSQKNLNVNKASDIELLTSITIPEIGPTQFDVNTPAYDDSYYVTNNYYDYHGMDSNYNDLENKDDTTKSTIKTKEKSTIKHDKRDLKSQYTFTAKDVAAIEVIVDLLRHNRNSNDNDVNDVSIKSTSAFARPMNPTQTTGSAQMFRKSDLFKNSIQVHIAIPCNLTIEKKRSLNQPVRIRKVFSARLSTPVDMEYQIHSLEDLESLSTVPNSGISFTTIKTTAAPEKFSPGLYVLVENKNGSFPDGQFILKPVYNNNLLFDYTVRQAVPKDISTEKVTSTQPSNLSKVTLSKDFIAAVNKHLMELYRNMAVTPEHDIKERKLESVNITSKSNNGIDTNNNRQKRNKNWDTIKKYFGHDKVCSCHCKPNRTMCRTCAASDAVISELIFELDNLAQYMSDHCTEIQTYFWMNPSGGRRLRDAVQRIDKALYNYFKRVKGKCKGRPCKVFTCIDKRDYVYADKKLNYIGDPLIRDIERVADHIEQASKYNIGDKNLFETGNKCLDVITKCMHLKPFNKRAHESDNRRVKNVYSLDNVNVNIICKSDRVDSTHNNAYYSSTGSTSYLTESPNIFYYDDTGDYTMEEKNKKGFKSLLKRKGHLKNKRKNKKLWFTYNVTSLGDNNNVKFKKRDVKSNYQMELPFIGRNKGLMWYNFLKNYKNRSHDLGEINPKDNSYTNSVADHDITNILNVSFTMNHTKHDPGTIENNKNKSIDVYPTYSRDFNNVTPQTNIRSKFKPFGPALGKKHKVNSLKTIIPTSNKLRDMENYESIQDVTIMDSNTSNIQIKKNNNERPVPNVNHKVQSDGNSFHKYDKVSELTTTAMNNNLANVKTTRQNFIQRFREITLKFLNGFQLDKKATSPIYTIYKSTKYKRDLKNSHTKAKKVLRAKLDSNRNEILRDKISYPLDSSLTEKKQLESDLNESTNNKRELLLSILDFETGKLNDEWEMVAAKKAPKEDGDEDNQSIFQIHSEVSMPPPKSARPKIEHTITATNPCCKSKHTSAQKQNKTCKPNTKCTNRTTTSSPCKQTNSTSEECEIYDIKKDLPEIELSVPPDLFTTRAYHGFLDKFINQFRFKVVPKCQTAKAAKSHPNGPKGRSFKRKLQHGNRFQGKLRYKTTNKESQSSRNGVRPGALRPPGTIIIRITELAPVSGTAEDLRGNASYSNKTTLSTTLKKESKTTESITPEGTTGTGKTSKRAEETRQPPVNCTKPVIPEEACDTGSQEYICDIDATVIHILSKYRTLAMYEFKKFVKNITCFRYKRRPSIFRIRAKIKKKVRQHVRSEEGNRRWRWNWVRGKRSFESMNSFRDITNTNDNGFDYFDGDNKNEDIEIKSLRDRFTNTMRNDVEDYDRLYLGGDGVYRGRDNERKKRKVDMTDVISGLKSLPPLRELVDEVFVIRGNPVTIYCNVSGTPLYSISNLTNMYRYSWAAERKSMLSNPNLRIVGPSLVINDVQPRNYGTYTCCQDRIVTRSVRLNVIEIPNFKIVFTPLYKCLGECTYEDLENIQSLGKEMMKSANCCGLVPCAIRVDNPVTYSNKENEDLLKPTIVVTAAPPPAIDCDPECLRDLTCSLALLWAANAPSLAIVKVVIMYEKFNNTLTPVDSSSAKMIVSQKLKSRDSNGHREYIDLSLNMSPGDVDVVVACPAGFYLLTEQKICAVCPANTCAAEGENTCSACPRGTHSEPGSAACRLGLGRLHSYVDKCAKVPWQLWAGGCLLSFIGLCLVLGFWLCRRSTARPRSRHSKPFRSTEYSDRWLGVGQRHPRRPLSPSRVLLERIYKRSQSSSRATDSQETKFVVTQMNIPPPVPPIDFDY